MVRMPSRRVVIVGGGLAGLFAARSLGSSDVAVTLVDRAQRRLFQPLRYQVAATGILSEGQSPRRCVTSSNANGASSAYWPKSSRWTL